MSRKAVHHAASPLQEAHAVNQRNKLFGETLQRLCLERGWNQSELARRAKDENGDPMGRDAISTYIRGRSFPEPVNLHRLAKALNVTIDELVPGGTRFMTVAPETTLEIRQIAGEPGKVWIRMNQAVTTKQAAEIFNIVRGEE